MNKLPVLIIVICLSASSALASYTYSKDIHYTKGYSDASAKYEGELSAARSQQDWTQTALDNRNEDYDALVTQYNNLYIAAQAAINTNNYRPPSSFTCTSTQWSFNNTTTTRCY